MDSYPSTCTGILMCSTTPGLMRSVNAFMYCKASCTNPLLRDIPAHIGPKANILCKVIETMRTPPETHRKLNRTIPFNKTAKCNYRKNADVEWNWWFYGMHLIKAQQTVDLTVCFPNFKDHVKNIIMADKTICLNINQIVDSAIMPLCLEAIIRYHDLYVCSSILNWISGSLQSVRLIMWILSRAKWYSISIFLSELFGNAQSSEAYNNS